MSQQLREALITHFGMSADDFERARHKAVAERISIMHAIEMLAIWPEDKVLDAFGRFYRIQIANLGDMEVPRTIVDLLPRDLAIKYRIVPIDRAGANVIAAVGDPTNLQALNEIRAKTGYAIKPVLASEVRISAALEKYYSRKIDVEKITGESERTMSNVVPKRRSEDVRVSINSAAGTESGDGPIIKLVNSILLQCAEKGGSDVHIEPYETYLRVRLRIDGVLHEIARPPLGMKESLTTRIKIMARLNIAERRLPQDGQISVKVGERPVDFRVSCIPTYYGEKIVMRILDKSSLQVDMTKLGFDADELAKFKAAIMKPYGMVLVTGPTGSGKTTTLYSALTELNKESDNIMTAEDPVEFQIEGVNQVQMKPEIELTFASALRSFLRQDPDVIMVGEIRDLETADIAVKAALTGHIVLSTLHTNSAPDTVARLLNMGVESFNLVSALNSIVAQRLGRKICQHCREIDPEVTPEALVALGVPSSYKDKVKSYRGKGCNHCFFTGARGRIAIYEVMTLSDEVKDAVIRGVSVAELKKIAMAGGMRTLRQAALNKMVQGLITAAEVVAVTAADQDDSSQSRSAA